MKIVLVTTDPVQTAPLVAVLTMLDQEVRSVQHCDGAAPRLRDQQADLVVVDWRMSVAAAVGWLQWLRARHGRRASVLFWTRHLLDATLCLDAVSGSPVPTPLPVALQELVTAVNASLNSYCARPEPVGKFLAGPYEISAGARKISLDGKAIALTATEFDLAELLFRNHGKALQRKVIWSVLRGDVRELGSRALDTHMSNIRSKLVLSERNGVKLTAVYGHGYRLDILDSQEEDLQEMAATAPA